MKMKLFIALFMPFNLIAGDTDNYPAPLKLLTQQGGEIVSEFKAPAKMTGYVANIQGQTITLYVTKDEKYLFTGSMLDVDGNDVGKAFISAYENGPKAIKNWQALENSHWVRDGSSTAPRIVYTFTDPNCPYCQKLWKSARPWVESGEVQLRHILVGILKADSYGKAAAILSISDPDAQSKQLEKASIFHTVKVLANPTKDVANMLSKNHQTMVALGARATPATFYKNQKGELKTQVGLPPKSLMAEIFGASKSK